ncbi:oligosaccharide flippase family protein [Parasalinivibrio latis]|uniref:oligosaccharide flippase family protein n=1 Tax=Parasalinivibrio latis TaxID=2952610 RepID=UPI0030DF95FB
MKDSLWGSLTHGYLWNLVAKLVSRFIGIISLIVLARILTPADFGIAALTTMVITLFATLSETGSTKYLIKSDTLTETQMYQVWSLNLALKSGLYVLLFMLAPAISSFLNEPLLTGVIRFAGLLLPIQALKNIRLVELERALNYAPISKMQMTTRLTVFPITVALALYFEDYRALITGSLLSETLVSVLSYRLVPRKPKWISRGWLRYLNFSSKMMLVSASGALRSRIDSLLIGKFLTGKDVGLYRVSQELGWLPFSELIEPVTAPLYAAFGKQASDRAALAHTFNLYLCWTYLLVVPAALGVSAVSQPAVAIILGTEWAELAPVLSLITLLMLTMPLNIGMQNLLTIKEKLPLLALVDAIIIAAISSVFYFLYRSGEALEGYTIARVGIAVLFLALLSLLYVRYVSRNLVNLAVIFLVPSFPAIVMFFVVHQLQLFLPVSIISLILVICAGAITYLLLVLPALALASTFHPGFAVVWKALSGHFLKLSQKLGR